MSRFRLLLRGLFALVAAVVIFEVVGPLLTRRALIATGEAKTIPSPLLKADSQVSM